MVSLVNAARIKSGKSPLGFLNPILWSFGTNLTNDISKGDNKCTSKSSGVYTCCNQGFTASKGWDPVTGFGSVSFNIYILL